MNGFSTHIFLFIIPAIIGNVLHMVIVKKNIFPSLAIPISNSLFGKNKTWRGFVFLPLAIGIFSLINSIILGPFANDYLSDFLVGAGIGLSYMIAELPNSYFKRKKGIAPGTTTNKFWSWQMVIDKSDSIIGACLFYYLIMDISTPTIAIIFLLSFVIHVSISSLLVYIKLKKSI